MSFFSSLRTIPIKETEKNGKLLQSEVLNISINNSGTKVVVSRLDRSLKIWRVNGQSLSDPVTILSAHARGVSSISWHPTTEAHFVTVGLETRVKFWSPMGRLEKEVSAPSRCKLVQYSPDGEYLAVVSESDQIYIYKVSDKIVCVAEASAENTINAINWSNQGHSMLAVALNNGTVQLMSFNESALEPTHKLCSGSLASCILFDILGRYIAIGSGDGVVYLWRTSDLVCFKVLGNSDYGVVGLSTDREGAYICVSYKEGSSRVFDYESLQEVYDLKDLRSARQCSPVAWYPSRTVLISTQDRGRALCNTKRERIEDRPRR